MHLYAAQRNHKCHKCAVAPHEIENKYVFKCALKAANDRAVSRRLNGSSFHARGPGEPSLHATNTPHWKAHKLSSVQFMCYEHTSRVTMLLRLYVPERSTGIFTLQAYLSKFIVTRSSFKCFTCISQCIDAVGWAAGRASGL